MNKEKNMPEEFSLPEDYTPFEELIICSNNFKGIIPINVGGHFPFLVGKGVLPLVWISVPIKKDEWIYIVERNTSLSNIINVKLSKESHKVTVSLKDERIIMQKPKEWKIPLSKIIIEIIKERESKAIITQLDLRSTGFNIYGDKDKLYFGTNEFANNTFSSKVMMAIGA